jgi:hypothetical protein
VQSPTRELIRGFRNKSSKVVSLFNAVWRRGREPASGEWVKNIAQFCLGVAYQMSWGVPQDYEARAFRQRGETEFYDPCGSPRRRNWTESGNQNLIRARPVNTARERG